MADIDRADDAPSDNKIIIFACKIKNYNVNDRGIDSSSLLEHDAEILGKSVVIIPHFLFISIHSIQYFNFTVQVDLVHH